jgi:hypothetical protein
MRSFASSFLVMAFVAAVAACGPAKRGDDFGNGSGSGSGNSCTACGTLTGKVYAPKWGPGQVPSGQEIPIFGANVYVSAVQPQPIPDHVYCQACVDAPDNAVVTDHDGSFSLTIEPGHYWFVIEKGQFRLEQELDVALGTVALSPMLTTLPSRQDNANGAFIPRIAIAYGNYDAVGDILAKIGIGTLNGEKNPHTTAGIDDGDSTSEITFYDYDTTGVGSVAELVSNLDEMSKYHIIFFPCSTEVDDTLLADQAVLKNIRQYVAAGGKIYVTDWSGETADRAFPPQLTLGDGGFEGDIDSVGTYDPVAFTGTLTAQGTADGDLYTATDGKAVDPDLEAWLGLQTGPNEDDAMIGLYNPNQFTVVDNWNWISKLNSVMKGSDMDGMPVYDDPKAWITGSDESGHGPHPLAVTYEPTGCGKVLYSTFQTSGASADEMHAGLMPQERVLLFLIMEIDACTQNPIIL